MSEGEPDEVSRDERNVRRHPLISKTAQAGYFLAILVAIPYWVSPWIVTHEHDTNSPAALQHFKVLTPRDAPPTQTELSSSSERAQENPLGEPAAVSENAKATLPAVDDDGAHDDRTSKAARSPWVAQNPTAPSSKQLSTPQRFDERSRAALASFYDALVAVRDKRPNAVARVLFYGDSTIMPDWTTGPLRRRLQARFGDAGHGFVLPVSGWRDYHHDDVSRSSSREWIVSRIVPGGGDGIYGIGGVSAEAHGAGLLASLGTSKRGPVGHSITRFDLSYLAHSTGGTFDVRVDDQTPREVDTRSEISEVRTLHLDVEDGPHRLDIHTAGHGIVRLLGVELLRNVPGVIVDSLGIGGARLRALLQLDEAHWVSELRRRAPSLVVFAFGANEGGEPFADEHSEHKRTGEDVFARFRRALPDTSCLVVSAYDRASPAGGSDPSISDLVQAQRDLATRAGCAFFDTFTAMGGVGSMARWTRSGLGSGDLIHPTAAGADQLATWLYDAWMADLDER